jgi:hypothetical protein
MRWSVFATLLALSAMLGCGTAEPPLPAAAAVKGTVHLDGRPMAAGEIVFTQPGLPEHRIPVYDGAYAGEALVGANQVGVFSYIESPPDSGLSTDEVKQTNVVADRFSFHTKLTADVKKTTPDAPNQLNFETTTR